MLPGYKKNGVSYIGVLVIIIILRKPVGVHYWGPDDKDQHRRGPSFGVYYKKVVFAIAVQV